MNKTRIEWADYTWNPIKGVCPEGCWYCYARAMYRRFKRPETPTLDIAEFKSPIHWADEGKRIFVCSTFELFNPVADAWRDDIFEVIEYRSDMTFIILTKRPDRIDRPMPPNVWLGVSVTGAEDWYRVRQLSEARARIKFVSVEPFLGHTPDLGKKRIIDWLIVGRLTGHGKKRDPEASAIGWLIAQATGLEIPLFMKDNLKGIARIGPDLIQEFPK